ncbi:hypothetical protein EMN47_10820 [Prolixibacteraceae bacterium JC049]|nr:hypothetical protein [Prolixibacteraceae bacterium JC049]
MGKKIDKDELLLQLVAKKFDHGNYDAWRNKDFEDLSFAIHLETKILISPATLKRIFGKVKTSTSYSPQEATISALKEYSNFEDYNSEAPKRSKIPQWIGLGIVVVSFMVWLLASMFSKEKEQEMGSLTIDKLEGNGPTTAIFELVKPESKDTVFMDYGDGSDWRPVTSRTKRLSHFYPYPGYFDASLRTRKQRVSQQVKVVVPTKGWQALAYYFDKELVERYYPVPLKENIKDGVFHASRSYLSSLGIDSTKIVIVRLDNFKPTKKDGDNFTLKARVKNGSFWPGIRCFSMFLKITGTDGVIMVKLVGEGCSHHSEISIGDTRKWGSSSDLTAFAVDLHQWSDVEIKNTNKEVDVKLAEQSIFKVRYEKSIGEILGTTILFHGSGSVDYCYLSDKDGADIYVEEFDRERDATTEFVKACD